MKKWQLSLKALFLSFILIFSQGCGKKAEGLPEIPGVKGPLFNMVDGKVMVTLKLLELQFNGGFKFPIPETRSSFAEVSPNLEDGGTLVVLYLDVEDLKNLNIGFGDPNTLPDGRPVPGIPGGALADSLRVDTPYLDMSFYLHKQLFGVWIPFKFNTGGISGYYRIVIDGNDIGMLGLVAAEEDKTAGGIIFLKINSLNNSKMQKLINLSKRNPNTIY